MLADLPLVQPALEWAADEGLLVGVGASKVGWAAGLAFELGVPFRAFDTEGLGQDLASWLASVAAEVAFVVGFAHRIPPQAYSSPPLGTLNFHPGLLPERRGPVPVFWAIRAGEARGGVTVHRLERAFDRGPIAFVREVAIGPDDTAGQHLVRLEGAVEHCFREAIEGLRRHGADLPTRPQNHERAAYQSRPQLSDLCIDWAAEEAGSIRNLIRACNPILQGAITYLRDDEVRLFVASAGLPERALEGPQAPGTVLGLDPLGPWVRCANGTALRVEVASSYRGVLRGADLIRSYDLRPGDRFETAGDLIE